MMNMIKIIKQDITTVTTGIVAHGCNLIPVFGAGVALAIARKFPFTHKEYVKYVSNKKNKIITDDDDDLTYDTLLGTTLFVVEIPRKLLIANCFTQIGVGFDSDGKPPASLDAIESSLRYCISECNYRGLDLYTPQIGCGLGGLDWETQVKPLYESLADKLSEDLNWYVCTI